MVSDMLDTGASIVGGCCGTTPEHIAAMRVAIDARLGAQPTHAAPAPAAPTAPTIRAEVATTTDTPAPPSRLARALADGRYVISVEIDPPRSVRIERTIEAARMLQDAGVDIVNVSDSAMARVRMGALAVAFGIQHDLDVECVVHVTTRDRNLMALESELLGAHALGVRDILALTGDPPRIGDLPGATGVWDVDSIGLVEILARLNRGEDAAGSPIGQPASFTIACALDPTAADAATEWDRLERKIAAGAHLIMTQPLYSEAQVEAMFSEACRRFGPAGFPIPVLLGVLPLQSSRHAEFLHHEVPGITIPDATRDALREAGEHGAEVGLRITEELLVAVGERVAGTYVMPSFGRYEQAAELVRRLRAMPAARVDARALRP
jgi:homocysteine S-methyltransferase